jgi:hypothetical protein
VSEKAVARSKTSKMTKAFWAGTRCWRPTPTAGSPTRRRPT